MLRFLNYRCKYFTICDITANHLTIFINPLIQSSSFGYKLISHYYINTYIF